MSDLGFSTWLPDSDEAACFYSQFNLQKSSKIDFSSFLHDLGFGGSQFPFKIPLKKYSNIDFSSFWHDIGFGGSFFPFKISILKKNWKIDFFQLLARSWFWWQLLSAKNSNKCKKYKKDTSSYIFNHCLFDLSAFFYIHVYSCLFVCFIKFRKNRGSKYEVQQGMVPFWGI